MKKYEMYLSIKEYTKIEHRAIMLLKNFTVIPCSGAWKRHLNNSIIFIYIATDKRHEDKFLEFYEYVKSKLPVAHYVVSEVNMILDRKEVKSYAKETVV